MRGPLIYVGSHFFHASDIYDGNRSVVQQKEKIGQIRRDAAVDKSIINKRREEHKTLYFDGCMFNPFPFPTNNITYVHHSNI